jgi:predicted nucleic acid-binding protein
MVVTGLKAKDALHVACAISAGCAYFITTDDRILKLASIVEEIAVVDPTSLVREMNL